MSERLETEARKLIDRDRENEVQQAKSKATKKALDEQQRVVYDLMQAQKDVSATKDLGPGYGRYNLQPRSTIRTRIIDEKAAFESLEALGRLELQRGEEGMLTFTEGEAVKAELRKAPINQLIRECLETGADIPQGIDFTRTVYVQKTRKPSK